MNYIIHLTRFLENIKGDNSIRPTHVSLYISLFHFWNKNHFKNPIYINRRNLMSQSRIRSKSVYHRTIWDLHHWHFIGYTPSNDPFSGSRIILFESRGKSPKAVPENEQVDVSFQVQKSPGSGSKSEPNSSKYEPDLPFKRDTTVPEIGQNKTNKHLNNKTIYIEFQKIKNYFLEEKSTVMEAQKFFNYYESIGWKIAGKIVIQNWKAAARNWIIKADEIKKTKDVRGAVPKTANWMVNEDKDYDIPL